MAYLSLSNRSPVVPSQALLTSYLELTVAMLAS